MPDVPGGSVAALLDPHREVVEFTGRDRELAELLGWCADGQDAPLRLVIGPSGVGKTRLAVELARQMRARGWRTEWADAGGHNGTGKHAAITMVHRKTLLIIDRADERHDLDRLLAELTTQQPHARLLLLARGAGGWCDQLELYGQAPYSLISAARSELMELAFAVSDDLADTEIIEAAAGCFAAELGRTSPVPPAPAKTSTSRHRMLDLHLAALLAVVRGAGVRADPASIADDLVSHEERYRAADGGASKIAGLGELTARQRAAAEHLLLPANADARPAIGGLPTRVADWLAASELSDAPEFAKRCLSGICAAQAVPAVAAMTRAHAEYPQLAASLEAASALLAGELEDLGAPVPALIPIVNALPYINPEWQRAAVALCGRIVSQLGSSADPAMRAYWLASLGAREWRADHRAGAVTRTREAISIRRELVDADPDRHLASLASSLVNLGHQLAGLGQTAESVSALEEAALMYRAVAVVSPSRHLPSLAVTLARLARCYTRAGRHSQARQASDEATLLHRELAGNLAH